MDGFHLMTMVQVWAYDDAPEEYQLHDDDSDWVAFVPKAVENRYLPFLTNSHHGAPLEYDVPGGKLYIFCH